MNAILGGDNVSRKPHGSRAGRPPSASASFTILIPFMRAAIGMIHLE